MRLNRSVCGAWCIGLACLWLSAGCASTSPRAQRYGMVIGVKAEKLEEYKKLHAAVWPAVLAKIHECNIRNYSIYLTKLDDGNYYLFSYFDYAGKDFKADMDKMAADPTTQKWWDVCKPCQRPIASRAEGEWWANMEEVFHFD
jgi:L-rhamnose mutarotase